MKTLLRFPRVCACVLLLGLSVGCDRLELPVPKSRKSESSGTKENITAEEKTAAAKLEEHRDPVQEEIYAFRLEVRQLYNQRKFDELEKIAKELRASREVFGNGSWKLVQFYESFQPRDDEAEGMWELHADIHDAWVKAHPTSIAALTGYIDFMTDYAWRARGGGYSDSVTSEGWRLFEERLQKAFDALKKGRALAEKDPYFYMSGLTVALGQSWGEESYANILKEAHALEPQFWGYEASRAYSLLPRWHGEPGDWEAYAEQAVTREGGLGKEIYARIVMRLRGFHENIFRESKADWKTTKEGLVIIREKYPQSLELLSNAAMLAALAEDREYAKQLFDEIGNRFYKPVWKSPDRFVHIKGWADTGKW